MSRFAFLLISVTLLSYPFLVYFSIDTFSPRIIGVVLLFLITLRFLAARLNVELQHLRLLVPLTLVSGLLAVWIIIVDNPVIVKLNPVVVNAALFVVFAHTLLYPPSMIERIARMTEPRLPAHAIIYTRRVTISWCLMFVFNGLVGFYTAVWSSFEFWVLYNGLIAYILIALLFGTEYLIRQQVKKKRDGTTALSHDI